MKTLCSILVKSHDSLNLSNRSTVMLPPVARTRGAENKFYTEINVNIFVFTLVINIFIKILIKEVIQIAINLVIYMVINKILDMVT